ncbi:MAG TPA: leucyl aminopeptidase [Alphaproteobacteria bacterium]|nr:leucyl aminopeptidase [Alphaproteobacteria bacterium]
MKIAFAKPDQANSGTFVVAVTEERKLTPSAAALDKKTGGVLTRAMASSRFRGRKNELLEILAPKGVPVSRIVLVGLGKPEQIDAQRMQEVGGNLVATLNRSGESVATMQVDNLAGASIHAPEMSAHVAFGARLRAYRFDKYRTREKEENKPTLKALTLMVTDFAAARKHFAPLDRIADAIYVTRDLVSEPPNVIYPESLAERCKRLAAFGVKVDVLDEKQLAKLGMGALLGVGQGSAHPPRVVTMRWDGAAKAKDKRPLAFCGKGVTFDTGGISLKPAAGMEDMKWDMAGAAAVIGLIESLAARRARVNAVGLVGLVENMPSGAAQRPSDIVKSGSGRTIEVLNTDAEGRLVLSDVLWLAQDRFKPRLIVDLATLTGAVIVALGHEFAGLFSNNEELAQHLIAASKSVNEPLWRLPLAEAFDRDIDSDAADVKNIASNRAAGSSIGAQFLARFVNSDVPWAHLDIAGVAWAKKDGAIAPKGATAFGVRLLDRFVADHYEEKEGK